MSPVIVVGSGRGGTSAVAGVLQILGVAMGGGTDGLNEDYKMWQWGSIAERLHERKNWKHMWGWKDPNFVYHLDTIMPHLPASARFVVVTRSPSLVAQSLMNYDRRPEDQSADVYSAAKQWQDRVELFLSEHPESFYVGDFDQFRKNPRPVIEALARWLPGDKAQIDRAERYILYNGYINPDEVK